MSAYITQNAHVHGLDVNTAKLAMWVVQQDNAVLGSIPLADLSHAITQAIEDQTYKAVLKSAPHDFVSGQCRWPTLRTEIDPHAMQPVSSSTETSRNDALKSIYSRWATEANSHQPIYLPSTGYMHWLGDVDTIVRFAVTKADGDRKLRTTVETHFRALSALCEAEQQLELKQQYLAAFEPKILEAPTPADRRMTPEQLTKLYEHIEVMRMNALPCTSIGSVVQYLLLALMYGDEPGSLQPQRNDMRTYRFVGPNTDHMADNYISLTESGATLTLNTTTKPHRGHARASQVIALDSNSRLCELLRAYEPFAQQLQETTEPYLLCTVKGQPLSQTNLTSAVHRLWKKVLQPKLGFMASGCNMARRAAVDTARTKHGKRRMTDAERQEERQQCKQRGHSTATAEKCY
jgi:hypothetical protein